MSCVDDPVGIVTLWKEPITKVSAISRFARLERGLKLSSRDVGMVLAVNGNDVLVVTSRGPGWTFEKWLRVL